MIWELIIQGILVPGINESNPHYPFCKLTEYGKLVVDRGEPLPYDPDGYLEFLDSEIPTVDSEIKVYVTESLHAYRYGLVLASAVTLGAASEKAFNLLHEAVANAITSNPEEKRTIENLKNILSIKRRYDGVKEIITKNKSKYPRDISEVLETNLDGIFHLIRVTRNDAGHPKGKVIKRQIAFVNLQLFVPYCKTIYGLINWFQNNTI